MSMFCRKEFFVLSQDSDSSVHTSSNARVERVNLRPFMGR